MFPVQMTNVICAQSFFSVFAILVNICLILGRVVVPLSSLLAQSSIHAPTNASPHWSLATSAISILAGGSINASTDSDSTSSGGGTSGNSNSNSTLRSGRLNFLEAMTSSAGATLPPQRQWYQILPPAPPHATKEATAAAARASAAASAAAAADSSSSSVLIGGNGHEDGATVEFLAQSRYESGVIGVPASAMVRIIHVVTCVLISGRVFWIIAVYAYVLRNNVTIPLMIIWLVKKEVIESIECKNSTPRLFFFVSFIAFLCFFLLQARPRAPLGYLELEIELTMSMPLLHAYVRAPPHLLPAANQQGPASTGPEAGNAASSPSKEGKFSATTATSAAQGKAAKSNGDGSGDGKAPVDDAVRNFSSHLIVVMAKFTQSVTFIEICSVHMSKLCEAIRLVHAQFILFIPAYTFSVIVYFSLFWYSVHRSRPRSPLIHGSFE
jgi:hypothetical protein